MSDLATSIDDILSAIVEALTDATEANGVLEGIETVVRGASSRPMPKMPSIWVVPDQAVFEQRSYGGETWTLPITLAALVKGEPAEAAPASQAFAAKARAVALAARPDDINVIDVVSSTFDPNAHSSEANRSLFWTEATVVVSFDCEF